MARKTGPVFYISSENGIAHHGRIPHVGIFIQREYMKINLKSKISKAKKNLKKNTFMATHFILDQTQSAIKVSQRGLQQINLYFKSDAYEEDLDEAISLLHLHNDSAKPDYDSIKIRSERVLKKSKFVKDQAILFVKLSAAIGGEIGTKLGGAKGAVEGIVIGTATGIVIVTVVAGHIVLKRVSKGNDGSIPIDPIEVLG
jgi:hypothetical protein